jgi:hypothetical protein
MGFSSFFVHRSPGRQVDGGSLAEIFVRRSATRQLRFPIVGCLAAPVY